jgi:hypothetical protein
VVGYFGSKTTKCVWPQEAKSETVEVSTACNSFVISCQNVILYYINVHKFNVIAHKYIKEMLGNACIAHQFWNVCQHLTFVNGTNNVSYLG